MKIGLIDVDSHNFPNLCLMKLSEYHTRRGDRVEWWSPKGRYDLVYKSRVFTDTYPEPEKIQFSIPDTSGFENTVQQPGDGDGQNCLLEKFLDSLGSRHWRHLHSCLHYTGKI